VIDFIDDNLKIHALFEAHSFTMKGRSTIGQPMENVKTLETY
jgi:hypothetical protein